MKTYSALRWRTFNIRSRNPAEAFMDAHFRNFKNRQDYDELATKLLGYEGFRSHLKKWIAYSVLFGMVFVGYVTSLMHHQQQQPTFSGVQNASPEQRLQAENIIAGISSGNVHEGANISHPVFVNDGGEMMNVTKDSPHAAETEDLKVPISSSGLDVDGYVIRNSEDVLAVKEKEAAIEGGGVEGGIDSESRSKEEEEGNVSNADNSILTIRQSVEEGKDSTELEKVERGKEEEKESLLEAVESKTRVNAVPSGKCDLYRGQWVKDESYPLYSKCSFISKKFNCKAAGGGQGKDLAQYRWQPEDCELPKFDATETLVRMTSKRILFVGDSIVREMFQSLVCLLTASEGAAETPEEYFSVPANKKGPKIRQFHFSRANATFAYFPSEYLAKVRKAPFGSKFNAPASTKLIVDTTSLDEWVGFAASFANVLIFHVGSSFSAHTKVAKDLLFYISKDGKLLPSTSPARAFGATLSKLSEVLTTRKRLKDTKAYFLTLPYEHYFEGEGVFKYEDTLTGKWKGEGLCGWVKEPLSPSSKFPPKDLRESLIRKEFSGNKRVSLIDIASLSLARADAHVADRVIDKIGLQDCRHFCLPGIPDSWNELFFSLHNLELQ